MRTPKKAIYPLIFSVLALTNPTFGIEPLYRQPIAKLSAEIKKSDHTRIAQGIQDVIAKDPQTGEVFNARAPLMLTKHKDTEEWTISVLHNKIVGSTLLIGEELERPKGGTIANLRSFDRKKAAKIIPLFEGYDPAYYPDEVKRLQTSYGYQRVFTGEVKAVTHPKFAKSFNPVFMDVLIKLKNGDFKILITDKYGTCCKIAFGGTFSVKN